MRSLRVLSTLLLSTVFACTSGSPNQTHSDDGAAFHRDDPSTNDGTNGGSNNGTNNGVTNNGVTNNETNNGVTNNGTNNGVTNNGTNNGVTNNGTNNNGTNNNGTNNANNGTNNGTNNDPCPTPDTCPCSDAAPCPAGQECVDGTCLDVICEPLQRTCADSGDVLACSADGTAITSTPCSTDEACLDGECQPTFRCVPDAPTCSPEGWPGICSASGLDVVNPEPCPDPDDTCVEGRCISLCERHASGQGVLRSNLGCEFWSVLLEGSPVQAPAIAIVNPDDAPVTLTILDSYAQPEQTVAQANVGGVIVQSGVVDANGVSQGTLPATLDDITLPPRGAGLFLVRRSRPLGLDTSIRRGLVNAWQIRSSRPVAAQQFGPWCCASLANADASLLLPRRSDATEYVALAPNNGYITILGIEHNTQLLVQVSTTDLRAPSLEATPDLRGEIFTRLSLYDQLHLQVARNNETNALDLSGTRLISDLPVMLFAGHVESRVPFDTLAADHLEEQLPPTDAWATHYVVPPPPWRSDDLTTSTERAYYKLVAAGADVRLQFDPPLTELDDVGSYATTGVTSCSDLIDAQGTLTLPATTACELGTRLAFAVEGDAAFLVAGFTTGAASVSSSAGPTGDPAFYLCPGIEHFVPEHHFAVPPTWQNTLGVAIVPSTATLDDTPHLSILDVQPIPRTGFHRVLIQLDPGHHHLHTTDGTAFGLVVFGFDDFVGWAFPAGLRLDRTR